MTGVALGLITLIVFAAVVRMLSGHWMPIHSGHVEVDYRSFTFGGIPIEEIYDPATAVRHPYPLSEPCDMPLFVNSPRFEPVALEEWEIRLLIRHAAWQATQLGSSNARFFTDPA